MNPHTKQSHIFYSDTKGAGVCYGVGLKKIIFVFSLFLFLALGNGVLAAQMGESKIFNIESSYDLEKRQEVSATVRKISSQLYWYLDDSWWNTLNLTAQTETKEALNGLTDEFESLIYPKLTGTFGSESKPGIDKDTRITILVHPLIKEAGGYFDSADGYPKVQVPESNEREMVYLNAAYISNVSLAKGFLAHEFMHLITLNQKDKRYGISEEIWLNEVRSEYAPAFLGYDKDYQGSNLERRVKNFLDKPYDSLTEWKNQAQDYGAINLFTQYLVDHYGVQILSDSLTSSKTGISSLNEALEKNGFEEDFAQIFTDWTIAVLVNDCNLSPKYCYFNQNLKHFKVSPLTNFLPQIGKTTLSATNTTTNWAGNWHKFIGGQGNLKIEFSGAKEIKFQVPYVISDASGNVQVKFLELDKNQNGQQFFLNFGKNMMSLTIIPSIQEKISGFSDQEPSFSFFWKVSTGEDVSDSSYDKELIAGLLSKIESLQKEIAIIQAKIQAILSQREQESSCEKINNNLYFGLKSSEVSCLQEFLKSQGPEIYPEGLVTGNFLSLTQKAVMRFQEKYAFEILAPLALEKGTGFVGAMTRTKINEILSHKENLTHIK